MNTLKTLLDDRNVSVAEAAKKTGMAYLSVRRHVLGERQISAESAIAYEKAVGIPRHLLRPDLFQPPEDPPLVNLCSEARA